ncbi:hypothetical protein [Nakamurella sp.]|uniref:hypothetical protein n=1 Tax=Nakamurella sp. TaxID=1869182 RepID=UPI003B3A3534
MGYRVQLPRTSTSPQAPPGAIVTWQNADGVSRLADGTLIVYEGADPIHTYRSSEWTNFEWFDAKAKAKAAKS